MHRGDGEKLILSSPLVTTHIIRVEILHTDFMDKNKVIVRMVRHLGGLIPMVLVPTNYKKRLTMSK